MLGGIGGGSLLRLPLLRPDQLWTLLGLEQGSHLVSRAPAASPGLVSGVSHASHPQSRPASDPPGSSAAARTGESLRTREARDIRERDHLARVQSMVLGGNALSVVALGASAAAGVSGKVVSRVSGKVGRHASLTSVGRQHSGGGPLRPLILKNVAAGFYDTTLS